MDKPAVWVGVDVSKEELAVAVRPSGEQFSLANDGISERTARSKTCRRSIGCVNNW